MNHADTLIAEAQSWVLDDAHVQADKLQRERIRHYRLVEDLLLDKLNTGQMDVLEIGGGPLPVSDLLSFRSRVVAEPLTETYRQIAPCPDHIAIKGEDIDLRWEFDLAIATNSLDHVENPRAVVKRVAAALRPGGFFAILCAENNAITHRHPAHAHNLTARLLHDWLDHEFETVRERNFLAHGYRYGHVLYEGRRGQPAFALLLRKCSGY